MRILVIEDDDLIAETISEGLRACGYMVDTADNGDTGLEMAQDASYGLIILDLMLPGRNGWSVCETLRASRCIVPILMLTARGDVDDRVRGLDSGADDYLAKPFAFSELLARTRALLRRDKMHRSRKIHIGDLTVDTGIQRVTRGGAEIALTPNEYRLLEALAQKEGVTLTRDYILERIWGDDSAYSNTVDVCISQLRKKIDHGYPTRLIHTVHRTGYVIRRPESASL